MALVVITLHDTEDGGINLGATSEPFIPIGEENGVPTAAQIAAQIGLAAIAKALSSDDEEAGDDSGD